MNKRRLTVLFLLYIHHFPMVGLSSWCILIEIEVLIKGAVNYYLQNYTSYIGGKVSEF